MRPATTLVLLAAVSFLGPPARAQDMDFTGQKPVWANGAGLECRETRHPTFGYAAPSLTAPRVITFNLVIPVTGPAVKGFLPAVLRDGRQVWVLAADTMRNNRYRSCFVRRLPVTAQVISLEGALTGHG